MTQETAVKKHPAQATLDRLNAKLTPAAEAAMNCGDAIDDHPYGEVVGSADDPLVFAKDTPALTLECTVERAQDIISELGKVRCWLTSFAAARTQNGSINFGIAGEDSLRQVQLLLKDAIAKSRG